jgi:acylphosphatase
MMERLEAIVEGRVQGVMYRDFTQRAARHLRLVGEVENLSDGTVRVIAEGERDVLNGLLTQLAHGPFFAEVKNITPTFLRATGEFKEFSIR